MSSVEIIQKGFPGKADIALLYMSTVSYIKHNGHQIIADLGPISARKHIISVMRDKGIDPCSIEYILISHLHHDHAANVDLFPNATIIVGKTEWEYAHMSSDQAIQKAYLPQYEDRKLILLDDESIEVIPGLYSQPAPGHTPGSVCFYINIDGERWVIAGDAVKNREELRTGSVALTADPEESKKSIEMIREFADVVIPGHDCPLRIDGNKIIPMCENSITLVFPEGMTVNGYNPLILTVD